MTVLQSGRIREANDAVKEIIGLDPMLVVGRFIGDFVVEADRDRLADALDSAFARGPSRLEVRFAREGGAHVAALAASRLPEADPPTVLITGRDITSDREMRSRLMETERLAAVGELVAGVAHEVNNPLSSISAFAQLLLRDGGLTETQRDSIDVIKSEAIRASQVVKDLLAFARRSEPQRDPLDLNKLVDRTLRLRSYELNASKIKIEPSLTLDLPSVIGDARQLQQVILNLITNALQAMASQGGGTLGVITRFDTGNVILEITDTGPGIEPEARARIFEPFFTTKEEGEGTGLGLSVSYGIVNAHGGTINLAETSEKGTRFIVTLPAVSAPPAPLPIGESRIAASRSPLSGIKLLFVDDEPSMRAGVEAFGKLRGFEVLTACDGLEALNMIRATGFDAVVTDIRMPEMDGLQLYDALRKERPGLASRLIFITGDVISASGQFAAAKQPTLTKPFSFDKLEDMLVAVIRGQASHYIEPAGAGHRSTS
jgi:two-component system NtrC family sensor kinase